MSKIQIKTLLTGPHVVKEIDSLAVAALDGVLRGVAVIELLDTDSLAWLEHELERVRDTSAMGTAPAERAVVEAFYNLVRTALGVAS